MRIPSKPQVRFGFLWGLFLLTGCGGGSFQNLTSLTITATPSTINTGGTAVLKALTHLSDGTSVDVTSGTQWTISNSTLATVSNGALTAKAPGTLTVQAAYVAAAGTNASAGLSASTQVTITSASAPSALNIPLITWIAPATISYGTTLSSAQLNATGNVPGTFSYSPAVGTLLKAGTQTLSATFTPTDTKTYSATTASVKFTVDPAAPVIVWATPAPAAAGTTLGATQLDAAANVPGSFVYSPAAGAVLAAGTQQLTAVFSPADRTDYSSAIAHTSLVVNAASSNQALNVPVITWNVPAAISYGIALSSKQLSATANVPGTFVYTPAAGTVPKAGTQTLSATFTPTDTKTSSSATVSVQLTVNKANPVITWIPPVPIASGTALSVTQLDAAANVPGRFTYSPTAGVVLAAGTQQLTAVSSPTDATDYSSVTAHISVVVNPSSSGATGVPIITWNAPATISYGTTLNSPQLSATTNVPGTFTYTPAAGTILIAGTHTIYVTFTPTNTKEYSATTASVQLTVKQANPTVTWPTPATIVSGTALSATQLDATANVAGRFTYSPAAGVVLAAGTQPLTAVFSPNDSTNYSSVTAHNSIVVSSPPSSPKGCGGPTINLNSNMSQSTLQSAINSAPSCALVVFAAGTYNLSAALTIPCTANLTLTGPATTPATAILNATFARGSDDIFDIWGCTGGTTIEYLMFKNTGGVFVHTTASNITVTHCQFFNLPGGTNQGNSTGVYFDGSETPTNPNAQVLSNASVTWNNFGDANSCLTPTDTMDPENVDQGGLCAGILVDSTVDGLTIENNTFYHVEEGVHLLCVNNATNSPCEPPLGTIDSNVTAQFNDFSNIHRIPWEEQPQVSKNIVFQYNTEHDAYSPFFGSFDVSMACCGSGTSPGMVAANNVLVENVTSPRSYVAYGIEAWGLGAHYDNNLVQGVNNAIGIAWGYGGGSWEINNNYVCGPNWAKANNFIADEGYGVKPPPSRSGNVTGANCATQTSVVPTISPASGSYASAITVTLTDAGSTSGLGPLGNTSIYYTTDGNTPTVNSALYTAPFSVNPGTTVKAIGMWGTGANTKTYPAGYGFVPSSVVTATYLSTAAIQRPAVTPHSTASTADKISSSAAAAAELPATGASAELKSVAISPSDAVVGIGKTTQLKATATFSDGSVKDITAEFGWTSSDARTITANPSGALAGLATGQAVISGNYQGRQASVSAASAIGDVEWSSPIVINQGGTYSGNWQSTDANTPAVTVATTAPVIIENSHIRSAGSLIKTSVAGTDLTVRNSLGMATDAAAKGQPNGVFLEVASPVRLDVENNYIENAQGGVIVHGYAGNRDGQQTIVIRSNRARNMNGLLSDGNGGYLPGEGANQTQARFIQFDSVQSVPGIDVGWNEVINYPGRSLAGDNIDIYRSGGTANQPLEIHDTYIQGAYPYKAAKDAYTGGGIKTDAKAGDSAQEVPAFNNIHDNQVVGTTSYGIQFAAGHDNIASNNRVISSGLLADGTKIAAQDVGLANGGVASASMYNNAMRDNLVGWTCWKSSCAQEGYRKDQSFPASPEDYSTNMVVTARQITFDMENNEYQVWLNKLASVGIALGPSF
jgi:hypothetical protein